MYPLSARSSIAKCYQPYLSPDWEPPPDLPVARGWPALVVSHEARMAVLSIRQLLGLPLLHPGDLWLDPERHRKVAERLVDPGNGRGRPGGLVLEAAGDGDLLQQIREEEQKVLAAEEMAVMAAGLKRRLKEITLFLKALPRTSLGQVRHRLARYRQN